MGSSQLPPFVIPQMPQLPPLPAGSSLPHIPGVPLPVAGNVNVDTVLGQINSQRIAGGLGAVSYDQGIANRAYGHTRVLLDNDTLNHSGTELEIIARVPEIGMAVPMWMDSAPHRAVLMEPSNTRVGMGIEFDPTDGRWVIVAQFA